MAEFLRIMIPLIAFMFSPLWVPLLGVSVGVLVHQIRGEKVTPVQEAVRAAKVRSEVLRREAADQLGGRRTLRTPVQEDRADAAVAA